MVSSIMRTVFRDIAKYRNEAQSITASQALTKERGGEFLWATLRAHKVMEEYLDAGFKEHPSIAPMLTSHLMDVMAFRDEHQLLNKNFKEFITKTNGGFADIRKDVLAAKKDFDKGISKATSGKGAGKGSGNE